MSCLPFAGDLYLWDVSASEADAEDPLLVRTRTVRALDSATGVTGESLAMRSARRSLRSPRGHADAVTHLSWLPQPLAGAGAAHVVSISVRVASSFTHKCAHSLTQTHTDTHRHTHRHTDTHSHTHTLTHSHSSFALLLADFKCFERRPPPALGVQTCRLLAHSLRRVRGLQLTYLMWRAHKLEKRMFRAQSSTRSFLLSVQSLPRSLQAAGGSAATPTTRGVPITCAAANVEDSESALLGTQAGVLFRVALPPLTHTQLTGASDPDGTQRTYTYRHIYRI